jgi:hypothetical protein
MRVLKILSRSFCALLIGLTIYGILVLYSWGCLGGVPYRQQAIFGAIMLNDTNRVVRLLGENVNPNGRSIKISGSSRPRVGEFGLGKLVLRPISGLKMGFLCC